MTQPGPYLQLVLIYRNLASIRADAKETAAEQAAHFYLVKQLIPQELQKIDKFGNKTGIRSRSKKN